MSKDNVELICNVVELAGLFEKSSHLEEFLQSVVSTVAYHMKAAVCSIYLYEEDEEEPLILRANQGLREGVVGSLRMRIDEGITGMALRELRSIRVDRGSDHPQFKPIPGIDEEGYEAFLAVPILRGLTRIGVLVVQDPQPGYFDEHDTRALQAIAAQLATTIENAELFMALYQRMADLEGEAGAPPKEIQPDLLRGVVVSEGFAWGSALVLGHEEDIFIDREAFEASGRSREDFDRALSETEKQLLNLQKEMESLRGDVSSLIFSAHLLILQDGQFAGGMVRLIEEGVDPAFAITSVINDYIRLFSGSENSKLREKIYDLKDLGHRLLHNLATRAESEKEYAGEVVVAEALLPSDIVKLSAQGVEGLVLVGGSVNSHIAVLARSLQVPTVILDKEQGARIGAGCRLLLDGVQGTVHVHPSEEVVASYQELRKLRLEAGQHEEEVLPETRTANGHRLHLLSNINLLSDLENAKRFKAEGVGLYRSEFPFIIRNAFPPEEVQYQIYRKIVEAMARRSVTLRTLDIGGDKMLSYFSNVNEANPFLGLRALRFSLRNRHIFSQQLRAMLRAGHEAPLGIVFPLVSSVDDFLDAKAVVAECVEQLTHEGLPHNPAPSLGLMVELPSAVEVVQELAREADALSIGSNDLVQYLLAVDRTNEHVSELYLSHHPAVLRSLKKIADAGKAAGTPVSICGDMARDARMLPFLVGIGLESFSVNPRDIPHVQAVLRGVDVPTAEAHARRMLALGRVSDVNEYLLQFGEPS